MVRIFALIALLCLAGIGHAQQWPSKPVRVFVNVAPGGVADVTMRLLGARLTETLGQPFVVENRPGGDGYIGFEAALRAEHDGYTLVYSPGSSMMIAPARIGTARIARMAVMNSAQTESGSQEKARNSQSCAWGHVPLIPRTGARTGPSPPCVLPLRLRRSSAPGTRAHWQSDWRGTSVAWC